MKRLSRNLSREYKCVICARWTGREVVKHSCIVCNMYFKPSEINSVVCLPCMRYYISEITRRNDNEKS